MSYETGVTIKFSSYEAIENRRLSMTVICKAFGKDNSSKNSPFQDEAKEQTIHVKIILHA